MGCMTEEFDFDIHRSEGEGMLQMDLEEHKQIQSFLEAVRKEFLENNALRHLEDAAAKVVKNMDEKDRKKYDDFKNRICFLMESFLDPRTWEGLQESERDRILEFDLHESGGVG